MFSRRQGDPSLNAARRPSSVDTVGSGETHTSRIFREHGEADARSRVDPASRIRLTSRSVSPSVRGRSVPFLGRATRSGRTPALVQPRMRTNVHADASEPTSLSGGLSEARRAPGRSNSAVRRSSTGLIPMTRAPGVDRAHRIPEALADRRPLRTCHRLNAPLPKCAISASALAGATICRRGVGPSSRAGPRTWCCAHGLARGDVGYVLDTNPAQTQAHSMSRVEPTAATTDAADLL
jgi:hypothetical protein